MGERSEPFGEITIGEETIAVTRENLVLNRYLGANAVYDHCFITKPDGSGGILWAHHSLFEKYVALAEQHHAPISLNIPEPSDSRKEDYVRHTTEDLEASNTVAEMLGIEG